MSGGDDDERARVRQLLLSGDNTLKNRDDAASVARARARFDEALTLARRARLDAGIVTLIERRLEALDAADGGRDAA